jgi:hypothetical protein
MNVKHGLAAGVLLTVAVGCTSGPPSSAVTGGGSPAASASRPLSPSASLSPSPPASALSGSGSLTEFKGHIECGPPVRNETSTEAGDHQELRGGAWTPTATEMSDPRLVGDYTIRENSDAYPATEPTMYELYSGIWRIETQDGAWEGQYTGVGFPDGYVSTETTTLGGEGAFDGWFAVWEARYLGDAACAWDVHGVIFPAGPPEQPSAP